MSKPALSALCSLAAVLAAAGCGTPSSSGGGPANTAPAPAPPAGVSRVVTVTMRNLAFLPQRVTVHAGQTVRWVNGDSTQHNVTASNGQTFHSAQLSPGQSFRYRTRIPETIAYVCTIHPNMVGTLRIIR